MKYSIVIPTYNNCEKYLKPCVDSIIKYSNMDEVELVISANGCTDNTYDYLQELHTKIPHMTSVWDDDQLGFAKATNEGIKVARADKIVLLNNDTIILGPNWLERLDKEDITAVLMQPSPISQNQFAVFFCVLIYRKVFDVIGLLDEQFETGGCEDMDFCFRAQEAGFRINDVGSRGDFPIYHVAEGTMHDKTLVQNWDEKFKTNLARLSNKHNNLNIKQSLAFLIDNGKEAIELFDEVITHNIYRITKESMENREVIDIGANMGTFSLFANKLGAIVIAVEPVSSTVKIFKDNIKKSGCEGIMVLRNVVSDTDGDTVKIGLHEKSGHNNAFEPSNNYEEVKTITLKSLLASTITDKVFLKMDCEGGEYDILLNADQKDMDKINTIAIEIHGDLHPVYKGISLIRNKLSEFGFRAVEQKQISAWDGIDQYGKFINFRDLPITQEIWMR